MVTKINPLTVGPIIGFTSNTFTRLWGRGSLRGEPNQPERCFGVAHIKKKGDSEFLSLQAFKMLPHFDFTGIIQIDGLNSNEQYQYEIGYIHHEGELDEINGLDLQWDDANKGELKTSSSESDDISFVFGSCRYILRFLGGYFFDERGDKTFRSILEQIDNAENPRKIDLLLMVGDQIYADDMNFFSPDTKLDEFNKRYQEAFGQKYIKKLMSRIPTYMILDDHEIEDNWSQDRFYNNSKDRHLYAVSMQAYQSYQLIHSPAFIPKEGTPEKLWYTFQSGCSDFFVLDIRTERFNEFNPPQMIGIPQMQALKSWLLNPNNKVKFIVTSVPFFPDFSSKDKWSAFPDQRSEILNLIRDNDVRRVVFLSGDIHCSTTSQLVCSTHSNFKAISIISSSFFWPYPQGQESMFNLSEPFKQKESEKYQISYMGKVHSTDNFARVNVNLNEVNVEFFNRKGKLLGKEHFPF